MQCIWSGLKHALIVAFKEMRARHLAADATHRAILARKESDQHRLIQGNFFHFL